MSATEELDHIDRYFSKNWMDEDFPTDEIYAALAELAALKQELQALREQKPVAWIINTGHGTSIAEKKPLCEVDLWKPLYLAPMPAREGWKLVPSIPTDEMLYCARNVLNKRTWTIDWIYTAMLEAAPKEQS